MGTSTTGVELPPGIHRLAKLAARKTPPGWKAGWDLTKVGVRVHGGKLVIQAGDMRRAVLVQIDAPGVPDGVALADAAAFARAVKGGAPLTLVDGVVEVDGEELPTFSQGGAVAPVADVIPPARSLGNVRVGDLLAVLKLAAAVAGPDALLRVGASVGAVSVSAKLPGGGVLKGAALRRDEGAVPGRR